MCIRDSHIAVGVTVNLHGADLVIFARKRAAAKLSVDIKNDFAPKYAIVKGKEKLVKELKEKAANADEILLATDPDRGRGYFLASCHGSRAAA